MKWLVFSLLALLAACTTASGGTGMSPEAAKTAIDMLLAALESGKITAAQYDAGVAAIQAASSNSGGWVDLAGAVLASVVASLTGVRIWRGGINNRNGHQAP